MIGRLEDYLEGKELKVNVEKTKVMRFRRGGKMASVNWSWKGKKLKEVKEFSYLRYRVHTKE